MASQKNIRSVTRSMPRRGRLTAILDGDFDANFDGAPGGYVPSQRLCSGLGSLGIYDSRRVTPIRRAY